MYAVKPASLILNSGVGLAQGLVFDANYWEGAGAKTLDLASRSPGALVASGATWGKGDTGTALDFSAVASSVNYDTPAPVNSLVKVSFESVFMMRSGGAGSLGRLIHKSALTPDGYFQLGSNAGSNEFSFIAKYATANADHGMAFTSANFNIWYHLVLTWDSTTATNVPKWYLNGVNKANVSHTTGTGARGTDDALLYVGNRGNAQRSWDGKISYVRMWNRILSPTEAKQLYEDPWAIYKRSGV